MSAPTRVRLLSLVSVSAGNGGSMRGAGNMKYEYGARKGGKSSYAKAMNHRKSGK